MDNKERGDIHSDVKMGSERSFGLVFAVVTAVVGFWPVLSGGDPYVVVLGLSAAFLVFSFICTRVLRPLNIIWFKFGLLLGRIMTPVVMAMLYVTTMVPIGLILRIMGKDPLRLKAGDTDSYWINRDPPGPEPSSLKNQF